MKKLTTAILVSAFVFLTPRTARPVEVAPAVCAMVVIGVVVSVGLVVVTKLRECENRMKCEECGKTIEDKDGNIPAVCPNDWCETPVPHPQTAYIPVNRPEDHPCYPYIGGPGCCYPPWTDVNPPCEEQSSAVMAASSDEGVEYPTEDFGPYPYNYYWPQPQPHPPFDASKSNHANELQWSTNGGATWQTYTLPQQDGLYYNLEMELQVYATMEDLVGDLGSPIVAPIQIAGPSNSVLLRMAEVQPQ